jgi:hypothetical protein
MHIVQLKHLSATQLELLKSAPALITVLIGAADDNLDANEENRAAKAVQFRQHTGDPLLFEYFQWVEESFDVTLNVVEQKYSSLQPEQRNELITNELVLVNEVLSEIDTKYAHALVASFRSLAKVVAAASGGVLGTIAVSSEESELVALSMFTV